MNNTMILVSLFCLQFVVPLTSLNVISLLYDLFSPLDLTSLKNVTSLEIFLCPNSDFYFIFRKKRRKKNTSSSTQHKSQEVKYLLTVEKLFNN